MGGLFETSILKGDLKNNYTKLEPIDYNVYGVTHKCKDAKTNNSVTIRIVNKKYLEKVCGTKNIEDCFDIIRQEIDTLKRMDGEYSLHLIEDTETPDAFYIVMDIWDTNLEKYLLNLKRGLTIDEIKKLFKKLNIVFKRMYDNRIIHGNLKLSNILIKNDKNEIIPLLSEYGKKAALDERLNIMQSTSQYSAPELLIGEDYDYKVDLWSIGIILYQLYFNEFPFDGETQVAIFNDIKKKKNLKKCNENYYFNDLIKKLLVIDSNYRMTWEKYFSHKFWENDERENNENKENENNENENNDIENENNENDKNKFQYMFKKYKKNKSIKLKYYNVFYCLNDIDNLLNDNNLENLQKLEVSVDKTNKDEPIENLIYQELTKKVPIDKLLKLVLYGCNLKNIDILTRLLAVNLLELDLSRNGINNIEILSSIQYDKLVTLNLSHNDIYNIEPLINVSFKNLKNLNLSHNLISNIEPLSQVPLNNLEKLKLASNKIRDIQVFTKVPFINLTFLDLKNNKISDTSNVFPYISMSNLLYLDLSHNSIKTIEGLNVNQYNNLISLDLGDNDINNIDLLKEVLFNDLSKLVLSDNNIQDVHIFAEVPFKNLKELNLSYNKIGNIDIVNFMVFEHLEKLDMNGNEISDLKPLNQANLNDLKELELKYNKLKEDEGNDIILKDLKAKYKNLKLIYN